jgi:hypothetical protein
MAAVSSVIGLNDGVGGVFAESAGNEATSAGFTPN